MHTCSQLRKEILSRMPGGELIDFTRAHSDEDLRQQTHNSIQTKTTNLIAEPWYSSGSALKIEISWRRTGNKSSIWKTSRWTVRDLSSPMAKYIHLYQPEAMKITFEAAVSGHRLLALLILQAKIFDICRILRDLVSSLDEPEDHIRPLNIYFRGGKDPDRPKRSCKSFWVMRPGGVRDQPRCLCPDEMHNGQSHNGDCRREGYPYFYECLLAPLMDCSLWRPNSLVFDIEPGKKETSFVSRIHDWGNVGRIDYLGHRKLFRYYREKHLTAENPAGWPSPHAQHSRVTHRLNNFIRDVYILLAPARSREAKQLQAFLLRMRQASSSNPLSGRLEVYDDEEMEYFNVIWLGWLNWSSREILDAWRVLTDWEYSVGLSYMRREYHLWSAHRDYECS